MRPPYQEDIAACGRCGWVGRVAQLRASSEYLTDNPNSWQGHDPEATDRFWCPSCDESAQCWFPDEFNNEKEWIEAVISLKS